MVFTSWREVGSGAWIRHLELPLTLQTSEESNARSLVTDQTIRRTWSALHRTPETWLTDLSLTCSLTCPAGAERTHCGAETTGRPAPLATRRNPGFCCSRPSGWSRPGESGAVGWSRRVRIQPCFREQAMLTFHSFILTYVLTCLSFIWFMWRHAVALFLAGPVEGAVQFSTWTRGCSWQHKRVLLCNSHNRCLEGTFKGD